MVDAYSAGVGWARAVPIVNKCLVLRIVGSTGCTPTTNYGGCDQICLPSGNNNQKRCACATGFVLKSDGTGCEGEYFLQQVLLCLPPINEVLGKVMFLLASAILFTGDGVSV